MQESMLDTCRLDWCKSRNRVDRVDSLKHGVIRGYNRTSYMQPCILELCVTINKI